MIYNFAEYLAGLHASAYLGGRRRREAFPEARPSLGAPGLSLPWQQHECKLVKWLYIPTQNVSHLDFISDHILVSIAL